ncbi:LRR receptor-like serine/threonine-protein kinase [Pyrus ussuriensis x Pyrus communis]|uniref:non-specific serine/threonine protein kinase n=1 Tax=Pyrus ussuriensis x Pyrus communis TaxID=2448454 RepID=A0A5N5H1G1_9ROSA|nr:LRR receptor-like serine/threonine-protein kinase [Pyrus ussuriensis x Pyrus communis]
MGVLAVRLILVYTILNAFLCCLEGNERDQLALLAIKAQIQQDPHQVLSSWNESFHFCKWYGVTCSRRHRERVTVLNLGSQNLEGSVSPHIGNLSFLRELRLGNNSFTHQIPAEIGRLHRLQVLLLHNNRLSGPIPTNISNCFNLITIHFGYNNLVGKIPSQIGSLSKLQTLVLEFNCLTGEIPPSLGNLSALEMLAAYNNSLSGSIPSSLGQLKKLTLFSLDLNRLSGMIPPSIYNLSSIVTFSMSINQIQGSLPSNLGITLPNLQNFHIFTNQFTGAIPMSISNITSLARFIVAENNLSGPVPSLRNLHNLQHFAINQNNLGSRGYSDLSFISDLINATELGQLFLGTNDFGGTLPSAISNLTTKLKMFGVQENQLNGNIPFGFGNLISLEALSLRNNHFTGNIPNDIGRLSSLGLLALGKNALSGSIPSSLGNLTMLTTLQLQGNNLNGSIPRSLGECRQLVELNLSRNNLDGVIPDPVLGLPSLSKYLDLSKNRFIGSLPMEVGKLKSLGVLDVSDNRLSGELPSTLGTCLGLEVLHLQGNYFNGTIPSSMVSLRGVQDLDLSRNNFSGEIPQFLERFDFLRNLNLSFNDFWGAVPTQGVFKNASTSSVVGNANLCGGVADFHLPKCISKNSKGRGLSSRLKLILSIVPAFIGIAMVLFFLTLCLLRKRSKKIALPSTNLTNSILQVSYSTLLKATDGFSSTNLIGSGSFGSVYKGTLDAADGSPQLVAVKVFNMLHQGASKSFLAECEALKNIRHRNLVKIITACSSVDFHGHDFKALVYEFMDNGNLDEWLHPTSGTQEDTHAPKYLNLIQRLDVAIDVACALDYLHNHCETPIVHCDLKPSNVLLDEDLTAHVSDFGLARFVLKPTDNAPTNHQTSSIGIRGSVGYAAPEYGMGSEVSTYGDVYSFGILLLEMFTGKRPTDNMFSDDFNLHNFVKTAYLERATEIADLLLLQGGAKDTPNDQCSSRAQKLEQCLSSTFGIGIACSAESPTDRKDISGVASELRSIRNNLPA